VLSAQDQLETAQNRFDASETDENQYELDAAKAQLKLAEDTLTNLESGSGVDPRQLAAAQARLTAAEAALASAQAAVDGLQLKATLDGTVIDLALQHGQRVTAGLAVITVADLSGWVVETDNLTEVDVVNVAVGQPVEIVLDALPQVSLTGEVTHINARFEEKRGDITYTVTVALTSSDPNMRWGMTAAVKFVQ
jgi:HlyD family secretion protein